MSDDSDFEPRNKRRRNIRCLNDSGSSSASSSVVTTTRKGIRRRFVEDSSDSDSESSIEARPKRRVIPRVTSDPESDSSGSVIHRPKRTLRVVSDSSDDSDHGFEGSSSSQWETDVSDVETPAKIQDTGVDSDSSDGQSEKCPICLISFTNQEIGTPESCDHLFCVDCIQEWSKNVNTCPVDRQEFRLILVRKNLNGSIYREIQVQPPAPQNEVDILEDPTFCEICGSSDREERMLLCDGCDLGFHMECLTPPLADIPPGAWFCNDCTPEDLVDAEIELYELQLLLDDANEVGRPRSSRRTTTTSRLVPRTRQSERVRQRIANNRNNNEASDERPQPVSSTSRPVRRVKKKKRRKKKPRYRVVYQIDSTTGETIAVKKRRKKRRTKPVPKKTTVKKRLAQQLGICAPRNVPQNLPDVRTQPQTNSLQTQRYHAGIPTLNIFGNRDELDFVVSEEDDDFGDGGVVLRRGITRRRTRIKSITVPNSVSSSTDVLGSILDVQSRFHSKHTKFSLGQDGKFTMENTKDRLKDLNNWNQVVRQRPISQETSDQPTSSGHRSSSPEHNNTAPTSTVENSNVSAISSGNIQEQYNNPQDYTQSNLNTIYDVTMEEKRVDKKKKEDASEDNTPRSGTPASESEIDIYSDIETVTTSKVDEADFKAPSPLPATPNTGTDDDNNDSEPDMVIDTDKPEETTVTSTVDSNSEITPTAQDVSSSSEIQSQAIQSSNLLFDDKKYEEEKCVDDDDSEDGCPNFSIYSKETITMAKTITEDAKPEENLENDQVGEVSSSPATKTKEPVKKSTGLYSDSEDESIVKKENSFGITDLRNMTEDISEEERSYTPCLDERPHHCIEGLDTEMISDEDRNDFDESHDLKTASDGDALEINAKESELDFTRPEDYEEGEIVDKSKVKKETKEPVKKKDETDKSGNKENENQNVKQPEFKKLSKSNKERNYRDKDRERSKDKDSKKDKKKEKRKEIERYDVRALIAEKPRRLITKDKFGRDVRRSPSGSVTKTPPRRTKSPSPKVRRSVSKARSTSRERSRKKARKRRSVSRSKSRSRSKTKKRRRSASRERRRKSRSKGKSKKHRSRSRHRTRSPTPKRTKEWSRRHSRDWTPSLSRSRTPEPRHLTPSWTPPRIMDNTVKPHNLTVILTNDANKKKKEKKRKSEKKTKENERAKKRKRNERTPPPSKEVFASGDNILVSVSFNKDNETRDVSTKKKREVVEEVKKVKKDKTKKKKKNNRDLAGVKPVAIIDLERSPFKELTPSPKDIIVLSDSDNEEARNKLQKTICDSSQQVTSPVNNYTTGPKTPPEPQVKFTLTSKQTQMRAISNPLHDPEDIEPTGDETQENVEHKGPNTPPEPPNSPPSSPDAYDPFEPTKSRSPTPEVAPSSNALNIDNNRDESITIISTEVEKTDQTPDQKSHTPPLADVQPADSQSSIQVTPESSLSKSPERPVTNATQPVAQTIPFSSSVPTSLMTSTPVNSLAPPRINILSTTLLAPVSIPQRNVLPNANATSKPARKSSNRNGSDVADTNLGFDSPYSPGSSDYEDLFEPPVETAPKTVTKTTKNVKSPSKVQNAFDALFGTSPFNKVKKQDSKKFSKKAPPAAVPSGGKGTKQVGVKIDEDNLKILDDLPNSAVEMQVKDKFLKKLNRQERVVEEVKLVLKPHYNKKHINKEEYKDILRRAVPKICHNKTGEINPTKIKNLIEAYVKKVRHSKKVTSSSSSVNPQKA
ncbi:PHD and RING finger domain-containing protein 1 isoform X2 [Tribolium castaneum]|uniref:Uncharacterized protein n=1 Tax=Tribolium castaneum TaxID=7070 RepID=D6WC02_TRICA|nr:PREDICTED: PHD and RING finger domain-containing protein 1 isoform X2 [Tribolium castaneum]EEZ99116.2 hypothetical protein TcasGA2_TC005009 [Tribolium castaneum]|eukprot:XP_008199608.1 PREDICTED: PHD and RING finger domain-containing protein 1 isoform X2 [Tribolium castaneum]